MKDEEQRNDGDGDPIQAIAGRLHSRRAFLQGIGAAAAGAGLLLPGFGLADGENEASNQGTTTRPYRVIGRQAFDVTLTINGEKKTARIEPRTTLLELLRETLGLTGPKEVCGRGACGCCSVLLDGVAVNSCMLLAVDAQGRNVTTIEGIAADPRYERLIESFCTHDAAQCGYCIPGFVVRSAALLAETPSPSPAEIREGLAGNICRCGTYTKIFEAVEAAARRDAQ
ncbi:MAG: hypothetical protein Kow0059_02350 [Candidatus Sumerlaeia bacterium]